MSKEVSSQQLKARVRARHVYTEPKLDEDPVVIEGNLARASIELTLLINRFLDEAQALTELRNRIDAWIAVGWDVTFGAEPSSRITGRRPNDAPF